MGLAHSTGKHQKLYWHVLLVQFDAKVSIFCNSSQYILTICHCPYCTLEDAQTAEGRMPCESRGCKFVLEDDPRAAHVTKALTIVNLKAALLLSIEFVPLSIELVSGQWPRERR